MPLSSSVLVPWDEALNFLRQILLPYWTDVDQSAD
jgi:hypothetical protein